MSSSLPSRREWAFLALLIFLIRAVFVWQWSHSPWGLAPYLDAEAYHQWALDIARGQWHRGAVFYQNPLYPYLLALFYTLGGTSVLAVGLVQATMSAVTGVLLAQLAARLGGRAGFWLAGIVFAADRSLIFYSAPILKETLTLFLMAVGLFFWWRARERTNEQRGWIAAGLALGFAVLSRTNALLLFPLLTWDAWRSQKFKRASRTLAVTIAVAAPLCLSLAHNRFWGGDWVLVNASGGFNFYIGHSPSATGSNTYPEGISTDSWQEEKDTQYLASREAGRALLPSEASSHWFQKGLRYAIENPGQEAALLLNKIVLFFNQYEGADNYDVDFVAREFSTILRFPWLSFAVVSTLAALGAAVSRGSILTRGLLLAFTLYLASALLFYVTDRYRLPALIFLIPLVGAVPLWWRVKSMRERAWALSALPVALLGFYPLSVDLTRTDAYGWGTIASLLSDAGQNSEALAAFEKARQLEPRALTASAFIKASTAAELGGDLLRAEQLLREATEQFPKDGFTHYNLGRFYLEHGEAARSLDFFQKAVELLPTRANGYLGLTIAYLKLERRDEARAALERGLAIEPENLYLLNLKSRPL